MWRMSLSQKKQRALRRIISMIELSGARHIADAQHIAIASVERVDVLVSWNFQHIVNLDRIHAFNSVNLKLGYLMLEIRSPREVIHEKEI